MTDTDHALDALGRAADELLPQLTERLERHGLGEIEVVHGDLRLRVQGAARSEVSAGAGEDGGASGVSRGEGHGGVDRVDVTSPAVGFFVYAEGLGPGLDIGKGDALGHVEVLGVRHDVRAPRAGTVRNLVAESGEAVEYGQVVLEIEPAGVEA